MTSQNNTSLGKIHTLAEISTLINSSLDIKEVLDNSLAAVEQFIEVETSSIFGLDTTCGELYFCCARGTKAAKLQGLRLKLGEGIAGYVAQTERPVISPDVHRDPRFLDSFDTLSGFTTRSILCVPLKAKNRLVGVLELLNKRDGTEFDEEDLYIVSILANQIGIALDNARLHQKLQEKLLVTAEELKFTQSKLFQSERLAALGRLAQGVAHEVRNPLTIIGGMAHLLQKHIPPADPGRKLLQEIDAAASRLERMVKEVESFARMPYPCLVSTDISGLVQSTLASLSPSLSSQGVSVEIQIPPELPSVPLDPPLMGQVFRHLLENALEAMPAGGELSLTVTLETGLVRITLGDTGQGIPAEILPLVFDPFFSTKPQGTGMGLTIAHRIISEHKGDIRLNSTPGVGTTVDLWLPRWPGD
jgi:two-component system, NtrC family, sensor histidine kinase HydH